MASSQSGQERHSAHGAREAPRRRARSVKGRKTLGALRGVALRLIEQLENSLPNSKRPPRGAAAKKAAQKAAAQGQSPVPEVPWTAADYNRLFGRNGGVVDNFKTLADLIVRLYDMERDPVDDSRSQFDFTEFDEEDLDWRITDELDRLAERRGQASGP